MNFKHQVVIPEIAVRKGIRHFTSLQIGSFHQVDISKDGSELIFFYNVIRALNFVITTKKSDGQ